MIRFRFPLVAALYLLLFSVFGCVRAQKNPVIVISTELGDMKLRLYDETPQHRDNFIKLARQGYYDGGLFHRVINHFMIQAGDPESKNAQPGALLGNGGPGYTIPAEFVPGIYHKKGALAAARTGDQQNPLRASSGSQFYIVQGKMFRQGELDSLEMKMNTAIHQNIYNNVFGPAKDELNKYQQENNQNALNNRLAQLQIRADSIFQQTSKFKFTEEQRQVYTTLGGTPHLDGTYTVFGEVIEGLDVLDKIAALPTDQANRPLKNITMTIRVQ